jgi:hypothetical protein
VLNPPPADFLAELMLLFDLFNISFEVILPTLLTPANKVLG